MHTCTVIQVNNALVGNDGTVTIQHLVGNDVTITTSPSRGKSSCGYQRAGEVRSMAVTRFFTKPSLISLCESSVSNSLQVVSSLVGLECQAFMGLLM